MATLGANDVFIPKNPTSVSFRPLKGVRRDIPGEAIGEGEFYDLRNMGATTRGPTKRGAFVYAGGGVAVATSTTPILDLAGVWTSAGTQFATVLTSRYVYALGTANLTPVYWPYSTGVVKSISGVTVKLSGGAALTVGTYLTTGDQFVFSSGAIRSITGFPNTTTITIASSLGGVYSTGGGPYDYHLRRVFHPGDSTLLDHTTIDGKLVIADHKRHGMYAYNGSAISQYSGPMASLGYSPGCVTYFKDRLWVGNVKEGTDHRRARIRWSSLTGDPRTWGILDYLDLPYQPGMLRRLVPLGNLLMAYFEDAIWYGVPTNLVDLPHKFDKVETGGIGLAGPRAITSFLGSHFFVGQDNIYMLPADPRQGPIPIGDPITDDTVLPCEHLERVYVVSDPKRKRVIFGFPKEGTSMEELWAYDYVAKAWSHLDYEATMLANPLLEFTLTWSDLSGYTWENLGDTYPTWDALGQGVSFSRDVYVGDGTRVSRLTEGSTDANGGAIPTLMETGDIDMGDPGYDKTFSRLTLKLRSRPSAEVTFRVAGSDDGGVTWTGLGNLAIPVDQREGGVDFAITGSAIRFRLSSATVTTPYTVSEMEVRVRPRGREQHLD